VSQLGEEWVLESSRFEPCTTPDEVFTVAEWLLEEIHRLLNLYLYLASAPLSVTAVLTFDNDKLVRRRIRASVPYTVYSADISELSAVVNSTSFGSMVLGKAPADRALRELWDLIGQGSLSWARIYDVIDFFGGADAIEKAGLATKKETLRMRRTANHYRHLGAPKPNTLPENPPTFVQAHAFAIGLIKKWLQSRI